VQLKSITLPEALTHIGFQAFYNCRQLTHVDVPNFVSVIGGNVFSNCNQLSDVTIPDSVIKIAHSAFSFCPRCVFHTNNPVAIEYAEQEGIPVVPLDDLVTL